MSKNNDLYKFELEERDGLARIGKFHTRTRGLPTPTLLPVINPNNMTLTPREMEVELDVKGYITNSYIINNSPELRERALADGVRNLLGTKLPVMTDSGTFQMYVYGSHGDREKGDQVPEPDPVDIVRFQVEIQSDIVTILDKFTDFRVNEEEARARAAVTFERAMASVAVKGGSALACTVQGGVYPEVREQAARDLSQLDCEVHPIGGVVPLMENYMYSDLAEAIIAAKKGLRPDRPVHLFGAGHPMIFPLAVYLGCDIFDSSSYAKYAKDDRLMYPGGTRHLKDMEESPCSCVICSKYPPRVLKQMDERPRKKMIALHNLHVSFDELKAIRQAIREGTLREMVERRARSHPYLMDAMKVLGKHVEFLERSEPLSRKRFFYTGSYSSTRPELFRYQRRFFERYTRPPASMLIVFEDKSHHKPYSMQFAEAIEHIKQRSQAHFIAISYFGPAPLELENIYPIAQSVTPLEPDRDNRERINKLMERFSHRNNDIMGIIYDGPETTEFVLGMDSGSDANVKVPNLDVLKTLAVADMQFGKGAGAALVDAKPDDASLYDHATKVLSFRKSKKTDRIRNVYVNDEHILSFRAADGYISLKPAGALKLKEAFPLPALRVIVNADSAEFNRTGKNVFAKFVVDCDEDLRPGDEALVVDENDELAAVGRLFMTRDEMLAFETGVAVRVRDGFGD